MRWTWCVVVALAWPALASAQSAESKAAANALFDEGRALIKEGKLDAGCAKFEASIAVLPQLGTRLNLADCHERAGRVASAWAEFREAASMAGRQGDKREAYAKDRVAKLEVRLPKLVITVAAGGQIAGLAVTRDGAPVPPAALGAAAPVNPGTHTIAATAPGRPPHQTSVTAVEGKVVTVEIPVLGSTAASRRPPPVVVEAPAPSAASPSPSPSPPPPGDPGRSRRRLGVIVLAAGGAAVGVGLVFGGLAMSKINGAKDGDCDDDLNCNASGVDTVESAQTLGNLSTITVGVGLAAAAAGAVLYLTAPKAPVEVSVGPAGPGAFAVRGRF